MSDQRNSSSVTGFHLPDFCSGSSTLAVVLIAELLALVLTITRQPFQDNFWIDLAASSMFLLWQGLVAAAVLCRGRPYFKRLAPNRAYGTALTLMLLAALLVTEMVYQIGRLFDAQSNALAAIFPTAHGAFLLRTFVIALVVSGLALRYFHISAEWRHSVQLEAQARIRALQARIRPHFLFNSMNTIALLTRTDPERAEAAVEDLADLFRANLSEARALISLKEELEIARIYQRIEQLRLGERLKVKWLVTELPMRSRVPSLLVQPLLENAVYHGIEPLIEGGTVTISGSFDDDMVELSVSNPIQPGMQFATRVGHGIAMDNIRQRLELAWPGKASVKVTQQDTLYTVTLRFPFTDESE